MSEQSDAWMPLYIGDYLRDTSRLTTEQHGAYLLLIMDYWVNGPLPDDDAQLAAVARCTPQAWRKVRQILSPYFTVGGGLWHHKRVDGELSKAKGLVSTRSQAGKKGAEARWQRDGKRIGKDDAAALAEPLAKGLAKPCQDDGPSQPPSQSKLAKPDSVAVSAGVGPSRHVILGEQVFEILGGDAARQPQDFSSLKGLLDSGWTEDAILARARDIAGRPGYTPPRNPIAYLVKPMWSEPVPEPLPDGPPPDPIKGQWQSRMEGLVKRGFWHRNTFGPMPGEPGCQVPRDVLAEFGYGPDGKRAAPQAATAGEAA